FGVPSSLTRESSQNFSALWRQRLEYYFSLRFFICSSWPARGCLHRLQRHKSDRRRPTSLSLIRTISKSRWLNCWLSQLTTSRLKACCSFSTAAIGEGCVTPSCGVSKRI